MIEKNQAQINEEMKEQAEYQLVLMDIQSVLATKSGKNFVRYLFKNLDVGDFPPIGVDENYLRDRLGFLRAGNSVFKLVAQANPVDAGAILAQIEKEKYVQETLDLQQG